MTNQNEFLAQVIEKAWTDSDFKSQLLSDPKVAIQQEFEGDVKVLQDVNVVVEDQSDEGTIFINIPPSVKSYDDLELTEEQLEVVAGGQGELIPFFPTFPTFPIIPIIDILT
jgi:hypothetical protein